MLFNVNLSIFTLKLISWNFVLKICFYFIFVFTVPLNDFYLQMMTILNVDYSPPKPSRGQAKERTEGRDERRRERDEGKIEGRDDERERRRRTSKSDRSSDGEDRFAHLILCSITFTLCYF